MFHVFDNKQKPNPAILLHPQIPKPLHGLNPRTVLGDEWWNEQRQIAYAKNDYCCAACGIHKSQAEYHQWLEAHECYEIDYQKGTTVMREIVALCHMCHNYIHAGRMAMMVRKGEMDMEKEAAILVRGEGLSFTIKEKDYPQWLKKTLASLKKVKENGKSAEWSEWRLIIDGKEYKPLHASFEEWYKHYQGK